ncbi:MAG: isoprenyl transferase [Armatimonadota bacterium]
MLSYSETCLESPEQTEPELDPARMPRHVAIIMDGNGRWAQQRGLPRIEGHRRGENSVREVVECCGRLGIAHLTLYTFSTENWRRSQEEVGFLMRLIETVARKEIAELHRKNVRVQVLGRLHELPGSLEAELRRGIALTRENTGLNLNLAINYGGRAEIVDAARRLVERARMGLVQPEEITEESLAREMYDPELPDPDLLIRTGDEMRLSNFLLWQSAYSELWVTDTLWPDFGAETLKQGIRSYQARERRFGGVLRPAAA